MFLSFYNSEKKSIAVPYNNDPKLIDFLVDFVNEYKPKFQIYLYFSPGIHILGSGRKVTNLDSFVDKNKFLSKKFDGHLEASLKKAKKGGLKINLLLNNVLFGLPQNNKEMIRDANRVQNYLELLNNKIGLNRVTIANPYILEIIDWKKLPNVEVKTSVNLQIKDASSIKMINTLSKFWLLKSIDVVELQKDLLRDYETLKKIRKINKNCRLSIIVNEGCLRGCPYQLAHQLHSSSFSLTKKNKVNLETPFLNTSKCKFITSSEPWRILDANWILPENLKYYKNLIDEIKLTDRLASTEEILNIFLAYTTGKYEDNLSKLISMLRMEEFELPKFLIPKNFFERTVLKKNASQAYFTKIWKNIVKYNIKNKKSMGIKPRGISKQNLLDFINN